MMVQSFDILEKKFIMNISLFHMEEKEKKFYSIKKEEISSSADEM